MAKKRRKPEGTERRVTPKELRHRSRQQRRDRQFLLFGGGAAMLAVLFVLAGLLYTFAYLPNTTAFEVEGQRVTTSQFRKRYNYERAILENRWQFNRMIASQFGSQPQTQTEIARLGNYLQDAFSLGVFVKTLMIEDILLAKAATDEGVVISKEEVDAALEREVANRYDKLTEAQATSTIEAAEARAEVQVEAGEEPAPLPTLEVLSATDIEQGLESLGNEHQANYKLSLDEFRDIVEAGLLRQAMTEKIGKREIVLTELQVNPRHILLGFDKETADNPNFGRSEAEALRQIERLLFRLEKGEAFEYLAKLYSDDPSAGTNEGDLGWIRSGQLVPEFEEVAFSLAVGEMSSPVKTDFGFHIIEVLAVNPEADRPANDLQIETSENFNRWLQALRDSAQIDEEWGNLANQLPPGAERAAEDFSAP